MADNPSLRDAHRRAADAGRRAAEAVGARSIGVAVTVETYSAAVGTSGSTLSSTTTTTLDPRPKVTKVAPGSPSYFGGGVVAAGNAIMLAAEYAIGPITTTAGTIGYTLAQLCPPGSVAKNVYVTLTGDAFATGGERFEVVDAEASRPHQITLRVRRTHQA